MLESLGGIGHGAGFYADEHARVLVAQVSYFCCLHFALFGTLREWRCSTLAAIAWLLYTLLGVKLIVGERAAPPPKQRYQPSRAPCDGWH